MRRQASKFLRFYRFPTPSQIFDSPCVQNLHVREPWRSSIEGTADIKELWSVCVCFAAFVAQQAISVVVLPSGNTETEESRLALGFQGQRSRPGCGCRPMLVIQMKLSGMGRTVDRVL